MTHLCDSKRESVHFEEGFSSALRSGWRIRKCLRRKEHPQKANDNEEEAD